MDARSWADGAAQSPAPHFEPVYRWMDVDVYRKSTDRGPAGM